jgi:hypothetical protein
MPGRRGFLYRRCPNCQVVLPASGFPRAAGPTFAPTQLQRRRCPTCGHVGLLISFKVIERPELDQGETS